MLVGTLLGAAPLYADSGGRHPKLDNALNELASKGNGSGLVQVIVLLKPGWSADVESTRLGGKLGRSLNSINGKVVQLPKGQLKKLADYPGVDRIVYDRMAAHDGPFVLVEWRGLRDDRSRHLELADVVQCRGELEGLEGARRQAQSLSHLDAQAGDVRCVSAKQLVLGARAGEQSLDLPPQRA